MQIIGESDQEQILHCAFRYALGRMTYIVGFVADAVIHAWPNLSPQMQAMIVREIEEAFYSGRGGMDMDRRQWRRVLDRAAQDD
jgi:isocitrate/isopropylmalate dehydrogenase